MKRFRQLLKREEGIAMATVVMMISVMTLMGVVLIDQVASESDRAANVSASDAIYQAAEAGVNDYIAKLTEDPQYYDHCVAKGESTRLNGMDGSTVAASTSAADCEPSGTSSWPGGDRWTYPSGKDRWFAGTGSETVLSGYAYNLTITPPAESLGTDYLTVVSTACRVVNPAASPPVCNTAIPQRAIEVHIRHTTPADFQYMVPDMSSSNVCWASTIYGKMYSPGNIKVCGATSYGDLMAENYVTGSPLTLLNGARIYDRSHPDIRTVVKDKINLPSDMSESISDVKRAAELNSPSTSFDDSGASAWRVVLSSSQTVRVWKCINSTDPPDTQPYCNDVSLSANVTLRSGTSATIYVNESTASFQDATSTSPRTIYVGSDTVTYTGKGSDGFSFTGARCSACGTTGRTHNTGERVSRYGVGGLPWAVPFYDGQIPENGAMYMGQDAIISWPHGIVGVTTDGSSTVDGRVTIATAGDMIAGGNTHYASESTGNPNDDVLGLVADGDTWLARYAPNQLFWRASTMSQGLWGDHRCTFDEGYRGDSSSMTFVGTAAYGNSSGCIRSGDGDGYNIDNVRRIADDGTAPGYTQYDALKFLFPPWSPVLYDGLEATVLFREVPPSYIPPPVTG